MDNWVKFNETVLPENKEFYSILMCYAFHWHAKASDKYMKDYIKNK